ncbi:MAG: hypothetical protein KDB02_00555 [Acidimicrobiales bacterium]|nr:hypothetical protein [Acidimicrobiales bacterium]
MSILGAVGALLAAGGVAFATWLAARPIFDAPVLRRTNFRGKEVPVAAGVVLVTAVIAVEAVLAVAEVLRHDPVVGHASRELTLPLVLGFGLLGAFDDLAAHGDDRGFRGHLKAMVHGRLSTGGLKLLGGGLLAVVVVGRTGVDTVLDLILGASLVALAANLGNLFDRAPGRTTKVALFGALALLVVTPGVERGALAGMLLVVGAGAGLLLPDLREELMLGDAGSNVLGAALGLGVVLTTGRIAEALTVVVLVGLNLASEKISFSKVIASVGVLNAIDMLGRRPPTTP